MNKLVIFFFSLLLVIGGCKYEDGPFISLVSIPNRIEGDYHVQSFTENGIDRMDSVATLSIDYLHFEYSKKSVGTGPSGDFRVFYTDTSIIKPSYWSCVDSKCTRLYVADEESGNFPFPGFNIHGSNSSYALTWDIIKLSKKSMWLKSSFNNNEYEVHLGEF